MVKTGRLHWKLLLLALLLLVGCGYTFPHVYEGPHKVVYVATWKNRTNKLSLDMSIYQSLAQWFQKTSSVALTKEREGADLILSGEIVSIDTPSISWNTSYDASGTKVNLFVRYSLKDSRSGATLWEVPTKLYSADYTVATSTSAADEAAIQKIINDLSEDIYIGVLKRIKKQINQAPPGH